MGDPGRYEHAVARRRHVLTLVEAHDHSALEDHLLVLDRVVPVTGDSTTGCDGEATCDEVGGPVVGAQDHLHRRTSGPVHGPGFHGCH